MIIHVQSGNINFKDTSYYNSVYFGKSAIITVKPIEASNFFLHSIREDFLFPGHSINIIACIVIPPK